MSTAGEQETNFLHLDFSKEFDGFTLTKFYYPGDNFADDFSEWAAKYEADGLAEMSQAERNELYSGVAEGFQAAINDCLGWFYWTYKVIMKGLDQECDDAARCVSRGWLRF